MKFKAYIESAVRMSTIKQHSKKFNIFQFSKNRVWATKHQGDVKVYYLNFFEGCPFQTESIYKIQKSYDKNDKQRWLIFIHGKDGCGSYLRMNWWNKQKCKWIHRDFWFFKTEFNWLKQGIIGGFIASLFSIITYFVGQNIGFNKGYENGLKEGKLKAQPPTQSMSLPDSSENK